MSPESFTLSTHDIQRLEPILARSPRKEGFGLADHLLSLNRKLVWCMETDPGRVPADVITMNSQVRLFDPETEEELEYELVYPRDADPCAGRVSVLTPLGSALLGARVNSAVEILTPYRTRRLRIDALLFQPEAAGRFDL